MEGKCHTYRVVIRHPNIAVLAIVFCLTDPVLRHDIARYARKQKLTRTEFVGCAGAFLSNKTSLLCASCATILALLITSVSIRSWDMMLDYMHALVGVFSHAIVVKYVNFILFMRCVFVSPIAIDKYTEEHFYNEKHIKNSKNNISESTSD